MNTCAVCNIHSDLNVKLPRFGLDKKLAFIERVCALLIEERLDFGHAEAWEPLSTLSNNAFDDVTLDRPGFTWPHVKKSHGGLAAGLPATRRDQMRASPRLNGTEIRDASNDFTNLTTETQPSRGSP
jgi:hypothetical protein